MKRMTLAVGAACGALALISGVAMAKTPRHANPVQFEQLDQDGDGQVTRAEMGASRTARLERADTDGDGMLSAAEIEAMAVEQAKARAQHMLERMDADGDGMVPLDEMRTNARFEQRFDRIDRDGDGAISKAEFDRARDRMKKRHGSE
ncbi:MAG: calcium-binding protein [Roseobacter sp.]